jgi:hypothetical protein
MYRRWPKGEAFDQRIRDAMAAYAGPPRGAVTALARELGIPRTVLSQRLTAMGLTRPHRKEPAWSPAEDALLETLPIHNPKRAARLMREHGFHRTPAAIILRARRRDIDRRASHGTFSATQAAGIVGLDSKTIGQYCEAGRIVAHRCDDDRTVQQGGHRWDITADALRTFVRGNIELVDFRRADKLAFFALIDAPPAARAAGPETREDSGSGPGQPREQMPPGWTPEKRRLAYTRLGKLIIALSEELNVPANELLAYALKGDVPPARGTGSFADTKVPGAGSNGHGMQSPVAALPAPVRAGGVWDEAKRHRLRELAGKVPVAAIASELGISPSAIYAEAEAQGLDARTRGRAGRSLETVAEVIRLAGEELCTKAEISERLGITMYTLEAIALENGIRFTLRGRRRDIFWTPERVEELRGRAKPGVTAGELATVFGVTRSSIIGAAHHHDIKLLGRVRPPKAPKAPARREPRARPPRAAGRGRSNAPGGAAPKAVRTAGPGTSLAVAVAGDDQPRGVPAAKAPREGYCGTAWVRLRRRGGTDWLRMDGLGWVKTRSDGYIVRPEKLKAVRRAFPLARECEVVEEPAWRPRDIEFAQVIR